MSKLPFLLNEEEMSHWALEYCLYINDDPEVRKYITDSKWAYCYCRDINDDPEIRKNITSQLWSSIYYANVEYKTFLKNKREEIIFNDKECLFT